MPKGTPGEAEKILRMAAAMFGGMAAGAVGGGPAGAFTGLTGSLAAASPLSARNILMAGGGIAGPGIPEETEFPERRRKFVYDVDYIAGAPQYNAAYKGYPNSRAMRMQTMEEHRRALNKYIRPGMGPLELRAAIEKGKEEEKKLDSFWVDDVHPRRGVRSSSSAVSDVHINPDGTLSVRFRDKGKWYTYAGGANSYEAAMAAHDLTTSPSLGKAINKRRGWWAQQHKIW